jgi:NitT/TauT family transport system substrate-binding protein
MAPFGAHAELPLMRFGNGASVIDAQQCFITVGRHSKLNFYREEGLDTDIINVSSSAQSLQALATGSIEYAVLSTMSYLPVRAKNPALDIVSVYAWMPQNHIAVAVKPDSAFAGIADLKGKRVGIKNQGDAGYFALQSMFKELGIDPVHDAEYLAVNGGGPAGQALYGGRIDAIAIWDAELARVELAGFKLRYLPTTPALQRCLGSTFGVSRSALKANPQRFVGLFRAIAKSTVFTQANPELAVRLHWTLYPESKPKGIGEEEALKDALYVLRSRMDKWFPGPYQQDKRMGGSTLEDWQALVRYAALQDPHVPEVFPDAAVLFDNQLIDEVNRFDREAVEALARTVTL